MSEELRKLLGYTSGGLPVWLQRGGAPEVETENDDEDDEGDDDGEDGEDEYVPPTREEYDAMRRKEAKASKEAKRLRDKLRASRQQDDDDEDEDTEDDVEADKPKSRAQVRRETKKLIDRAEARAEARYKVPAVKAEAKSRLAQEGWTGENYNLALRLLDLDQIELDDDGEFDGLDDQIEQIKDEFPQLFKAKQRRSTARQDTRRSQSRLNGGGTKAVKTEKGWLDKLNQDFPD